MQLWQRYYGSNWKRPVLGQLRVTKKFCQDFNEHMGVWWPMCLNLVSGKIRRMGAGLFLQRPIVKMTSTIPDKQSHYMAAMKIWAWILRNMKENQIFTRRRVCHIHTFVYILCIIGLLNLKNNRGMLSHVWVIWSKFKFSQFKCL